VTTALVDRRTGRPLDVYAHVGYYGPGEVEYTDDGEYGIAYRRGVITEHAEAFVAAGGTIVPRSSGSGAWAVLPDGEAVPVVCSEMIPVMTEDGPSDGRCGADATDDGMCSGHAASYRAYFNE
jgi:hypothetical protein